MKNFIMLWSLSLLVACSEPVNDERSTLLTPGQMPAIAKTDKGNIYLTFGLGDSLCFAESSDGGASFSDPALVAVVPHLASSNMCGPQIGATSHGALIAACTREGNLLAFVRSADGKWKQTVRINDQDTVARENFVSLATDGNNALAVWLDLRDGHNKIYGARSGDGGQSWSKNFLVYASPDTTVCECCKPSVLIKGNKAYVMFRNWIGGNRDLYLCESKDGGNNFGPAQKLGTASWALEGCPMDGGAMALDANNRAQTIWNRKGLIYLCEPGQPETKVGEGRNCNMASYGKHFLFTWVQNDHIILKSMKGKKQVLGTGQLPQLLLLDDHQGLAVWENEKQIRTKIIHY